MRTAGTRPEFAAEHAAADARTWQEEVADLEEQIRNLDLDHYELRPA